MSLPLGRDQWEGFSWVWSDGALGPVVWKKAR